jgi:AraC-like DNA-binding protein
MKHSSENSDDYRDCMIRISNIFWFSALLLGFTSYIFSVTLNQDLSVEELLQNLKTKQYSGKPADLDLEEAGIDTVLSHLEKFSGFSFELSPDITPQSSIKGTYKYKQVPWDHIFAMILNEFDLEAVYKEGAVFIQPDKDNLMQIVRENQISTSGTSRVSLLLYLLPVLVLAGGVAGILLYKKRIQPGKISSRGIVIDPERADEIMKKVSYLFDVEKVYRKENINVQFLSEKLSIPSYQLSWVINKKMNETFSELVNSRRIEEVKKRLTSHQDADKTILEIAFDSGFNTKTSFNRVFKKLTNMTPSQYRKQSQLKKTG